MRSVILVAHVKKGRQEELVRAMNEHEPIQAFEESGVRACALYAGKGHLAVFIETENDFQSAYTRLVTAPSWKAFFYKIEPFIEGLPSPDEFVESANMPFAGEITFWQAETA